MKRLLPFLCLFLLVACTPAEPPRIEFIGVSKGNLQTDLNALAFQHSFEATDHELIGIVAFEHVEEGTEVVASWFSPDDRVPPFGRKTVTTESGAKLVRFSLANQKDWEPAPYMLQIHAVMQKGEETLVSSESIQFAIGLSGEEIQAYVAEYGDWQRVQQERQAAIAVEEESERAIVERAKSAIAAPQAILALRSDITGDGQDEFVMIDTKDQSPFSPSINSAVLLSHPVHQFAIVTTDGSVLLSLRAEGFDRMVESKGLTIGEPLPDRGGVTLTLLPSGTVTLTWEDSATCSAEFRMTQNGYEEEYRVCR